MIFFDETYKDVRIVVWKVTEDLETLYSLANFSDEEVKRLEERFKSVSRRTEWTAVRALLYEVFSYMPEIAYTSEGAPYIPEKKDLSISFSHTKGYVAIAFSEKKIVGVDVERISNRVERIKDRFIGDSECAENTIMLLVHWSAKESVFKTLFEQDVEFKTQILVKPFSFTDEKTGDMNVEVKTNSQTGMKSVHYHVFDDFVLTCVV